MFAAALKPLGLTPAWAETLDILEEREPLTIRELGLLLVCEGDHPSRLVTRMVAAGLVSTEPSPKDDRARLVKLTPEGRALLPRLREVEEQFHAGIEAALTSGDLEVSERVLGAFIHGTPAGEALRLRLDTEPFRG
ncbi:MarR family transcriptional regulator [Humibacter soli]